MGRKVIIQVESLEAGAERFKTAWRTGEHQGEFITFETLETLLKTLTTRRWELLSVLQRHGPMGIRELARQLGRDVKNVHVDIQALKGIGLILTTTKGGYAFPTTRSKPIYDSPPKSGRFRIRVGVWDFRTFCSETAGKEVF